MRKLYFSTVSALVRGPAALTSQFNNKTITATVLL